MKNIHKTTRVVWHVIFSTQQLFSVLNKKVENLVNM